MKPRRIWGDSTMAEFAHWMISTPEGVTALTLSILAELGFVLGMLQIR